MSEPYYVYIIAHCTISDPEGPVKVGITRSLGSRLASIQTGNWRRITVANYFDMGSRELALEAERQFHEGMSEQRMCGEWFGISPKEALNTLCDIVWTLIEQRHDDPDLRRQRLEISGAVSALKKLRDDWGAPN